MSGMATVSGYHVGVFGPRRPSLCRPLALSRQFYNCKLFWTTAPNREEVVKICRLSARRNAKAKSERNVEAYAAPEIVGNYYLDELDVVTFLDPPKELIPFDPSSYNPASYLWKKVEDIPEDRRHHLISLLNPSLISRAWEVAGTRYDEAKLAEKSASSLLCDGDHAGLLELWKCRTSGVSLPVAWMGGFSQKAIFGCTDGKAYGRLISGNLLVKSFFPLYFSVRRAKEVMSTEQPCDLAYEFGDGTLSLPEYPQQYPTPDAAKHPWPFNDQVVIYIRHVGPGVMVGQAWQEGKALQQVPKKLCSEILMVKDYFASSNN